MATDGSLGDHSSGESTLDSSSSLGSSSGDSSLALSYASSEFEGADEPEGVHPFLYFSMSLLPVVIGVIKVMVTHLDFSYRLVSKQQFKCIE